MMSEKWNVELHMSPVWTAEVNTVADSAEIVPSSADVGSDRNSRIRRVHGHRCAAAAKRAEREAVLAQLRKRPLALYALLRGGPAPEELAGLLPAALPAGEAALGAAPAAACTCGRADCAHAAAAERAVAARLAAELLLQLAHAGLREALLRCAGIGQRNLPMIPAARRAAEMAGRPQARAGEGGAAVGEWIAEAAADGAMHQPGPGFGAVEVACAAGQTACAARADRATAGCARSSRSGSHPRARGRADVAGCPEAQDSPATK